MTLLNTVRATRRNRRAKAISNFRAENPGRVTVWHAQGGDIPDMGDYVGKAAAYEVYVWLHKAIKLLSNAISPLNITVVNADGEPIIGHEITEAFAYVNDTMSSVDLWQQWVVHKALGGESFFELVEDQRGRIMEIWPRRPDMVLVSPDKSPERLLYPRVAGYRLTIDRDNLINPTQMWHDRYYNSLSEWRGLAPTTAVAAGMTIDMMAQASAKNLLANGMRPDFAIIAPAGITATEREEYRLQLLRHKGPHGNAEPVILEDGVSDIKPLSLPPKDLEWLEQRRMAGNEVGAIFNVPDGLMGFGVTGYDTETKMKGDLLAFWTLTVLPLIKARDVGMTNFFRKHRAVLQPGESIVTDLSEVPVLQESLDPLLDQATKLYMLGYSRDEINARLGLGFDDAAPVVADTQQRSVKKKSIAYGSQEHVDAYTKKAGRVTAGERRMTDRMKQFFREQQARVTANVAASMGKAIEPQAIAPTAEDLFLLATERQMAQDEFTRFFQDEVRKFGADGLNDFGLNISFDVTNPEVAAWIRERTYIFANDINGTTLDRISEALRLINLQAEAEGLTIREIQDLIYQNISAVYQTRLSDFEMERIARTETHRNSEYGDLAAKRQAARDLGLRFTRSWLASIDGRERETHRAAHERYQARPIGLDEQFEVGNCKGDAPGLTGCPAEDIMCRCTVTYEVL
jgi:HK97 family phage portal protein